MCRELPRMPGSRTACMVCCPLPTPPSEPVFNRYVLPAFDPLTTNDSFGNRVGPAEPISPSMPSDAGKSLGVKELKRTSEDESFSTLWPKFDVPLSPHPLPVATYTLPKESMAGAAPACQMPAPLAPGDGIKLATCASDVASNARMRPL